MYPNMKECARRIEKSGIALKSSNNPHVPLHKHKWFELAYIVKGKTEYRLGGDSFLVQEGNYYIVDYDQPHEYHKMNDEPFLMINVMFSPNFVDSSFINTRRFDEILQRYPVQFHKHELIPTHSRTIFNDTGGVILGDINHMQSEYSAQKIGYREMMRSILLSIMIQMVRSICIRETACNTDNRSYVIADYIRMHYSEKIKIEDAFPESNYSLPYMSKRFKLDMGMTFSDYLKKVRIEESCRLLLGSNKTIIEIAETVGYPDTTSYHKAFKTLMQMSPHEYRNNYKKLPSSTADEMVQERIES